MTNLKNRDELDFLGFVNFVVQRTTDMMPDVDSQSTRLVVALTRLTNTMVYDIESTVHRPRGWSWPAFRVLFMLWLSGPSEARHVAKLAGTSRAAVSALVNTLERDGFVTRGRSEQDGRAVELRLTEVGLEGIVSTYAAHNQREQVWTSALDEEEQATLIGLLEKLSTSAKKLDIRSRD